MTSTFGSSQILILLAKLLFTSETLILALAQLGVLCITPRKGIFQIETAKSQRDFSKLITVKRLLCQSF
jgi:hypothetical protein